jgi:hypothetical protein
MLSGIPITKFLVLNHFDNQLFAFSIGIVS